MTQNVSVRDRFEAYVKVSGSRNGPARKLKRSRKAVDDFLEGRMTNEAQREAMERDVKRLLERREDLRFSPLEGKCAATENAKAIEEGATFALVNGVMVLMTGPSGAGKTSKLRDLANENNEMLYMVLDAATRSPSAVLRRLSNLLGGISHSMSTSDRVDVLAERLRRYYKLLIVDDCHFASWEGFEILRCIHDQTGAGLLLVGQPRTIDAMLGRPDKLLLFDQLLSRIALRRHLNTITRRDVELVTECKVGPVNRECLDFLYRKASGQGRLRTLTNLLRIASQAADELGCALTLDLLGQAESYLVFQ
jgi:DNA transposition AAA+ family ATPase